jgi:hypothetical protein
MPTLLSLPTASNQKPARRRVSKEDVRRNAQRTEGDSRGQERNPLLTAAFDFHRRGFCVIPIGKNKIPTCKWTQFQTQRPTEATLRDWFDRSTGVTGVGLIMGDVSGGLAVRDFDTREAYCFWRNQQPEWAAKLPTVRTKRGYHVYHLAPKPFFKEWDKAEPSHEGEYRGTAGHYVIAPPSLHPDGGSYRWKIRLNGTIPTVGLDVFDISNPNDGCSRVERVRRCNTSINCTHSTTPPPSTAIDKSVDSKLSKGPTYTPEEVIALTQPTEPGKRNLCLKRLAQGLKFNAGLKYNEMKPWVRQWHKQALSVIGTKEWKTTWYEFQAIVHKTRTALGGHPMYAVNINHDPATLPPAAKLLLEKYAGLDAYEKLIRLCVGLAEYADNDGQFFLSSYDVVKRLNMAGKRSDVTAWRMLRDLRADGLLKIEKVGNAHQASRYRLLRD